MNADSRIQGTTPPSRRELTVYDTPEPRHPEDDARNRARHEEAHPFLYYLGQHVPALRPAEAVPGGADHSGDAEATAGVAALQGAGLWSREVSGRLFDSETPEPPAPAATAEPVSTGVHAFVPVLVPQPAAPPPEDGVPAVAPAEIPRLVFGQVERALQRGDPATTLTVRLEPQHLGKVELAVTYAQQKVSVNVVAATQQAREHLDAQLGQIRAILHAHHLPAGELKVVLASESGGARGGAQDEGAGEQPFRYRRRRRQSPADEPIAGI